MNSIQPYQRDLLRIPDLGMTEILVTFADDFILRRIPAGASVLDIGCGRGVFCRKMAEAGATVTGVDLVAEEIEVARKHHASPGVTYVCMNAEELEKLDGQFDFIVSRFCFHHLDIPKALEGIKARLNPGGQLIVVDCHRDFWSFGGRLYVMRDALRRLGAIQMLRILPRLHYFFRRARFEHVRSDIRRLRSQQRYTFDEFECYYRPHFPGCETGRVGCAAYLIWKK